MECYVFKKVFLFIITLAVLMNLCSAFKVSFPKSFKSTDINGTCSTDQDCAVDNSFCDNSTSPNSCQRIPDYVVYRPKDGECGTNSEVSCLPSKKRDEICAVDEQCQHRLGPLSECSYEGSCICWQNATYHYEVYDYEVYPCQYPATKLGDPCFEIFAVADCKNIPHAICNSARRCSCPPDMVEHPEIPNHCIPLAQKIGGACDAAPSVQCSALKDTVCNDQNRCVCKNASFIPNSINYGCVPLVMELNASCEVFEQCSMQLGYCNKTRFLANGTCQCLPGSVTSSTNLCLRPANTTHRDCVDQVQCTAAWGSDAECVNESCACKPNTFLHNRKCIPKRKLHEECQRSEQCERTDSVYPECRLDTNSTENKLTCQCPLTHGSVGDKCYSNTGVGLRCSENLDCVTIAGNDSAFICHHPSNECVCPDNTRLSLEKSRCIPRSVELDDICELSAQCNTDSNQFCKSGRCACKTGKSCSGGSMYAISFYSIFVLALVIHIF